MSESDWSYINDKWGHDSDGMPNFMNDASFHDDHKRQPKKPSNDTNSNRTEQEFYESGTLKSEKTYCQNNLISEIKYFQSGNRKEKNTYSYTTNPLESRPSNISSITSYYENGNREYESTRLFGKESGYSIWWENGLISVKVDFKSKLESNYNDKGMKESEGHFSLDSNKDSKKEGLWIFWFTDDDDERYQNCTTQHFLNGMLEGEQCSYDVLGRLREQGNYRDNEMHGKWLQYDSNEMIIKDHFYKKGKLIVKNPQYE